MIHDLGVYVAGVLSGVAIAAIALACWTVAALTDEDFQP